MESELISREVEFNRESQANSAQLAKLQSLLHQHMLPHDNNQLTYAKKHLAATEEADRALHDHQFRHHVQRRQREMEWELRVEQEAHEFVMDFIRKHQIEQGRKELVGWIDRYEHDTEKVMLPRVQQLKDQRQADAERQQFMTGQLQKMSEEVTVGSWIAL
jgi:hypothetical protein